MKKLNVLSVTPFFPPEIGGIADMVLNLNNNLIKQGHDVTVIAPKHFGQSIAKSQKFSSKVFRINSLYMLGWPYSTLVSISFPIDFGLKIKSIMKKGNFDVVHVHAQQYPICWYAIQSAHKMGIPCVLTSHGMWAMNPKVVGKKTRLEYFFNKIVYTRLLKKTDAVIGLTDQIANFAKQIGRKDVKYYTIPNGADTSIYKDNINRKNEYREEYQLGKDSIVILFLGRLEHVKGIIEFAIAAKNIVRNNRIEVLIVGGGTLEAKIKSILKCIDRIHMFPWQSVDNIYKFYIASDIFMMPSRFEGLPLTLVEAMNAGLHIVYTPVGGIPEFVKGYPRKTLLKTGSSIDIENELTKVVSNYSSTDRIEEALNYARKFDWNDLVQDTVKVYTECLTHKKLL